MKTIFTLLTLTILLSSCGQVQDFTDSLIKKEVPTDPRTILTTNAAFQEYVDYYVQDYAYETGQSVSVKHIPINFGDTSYNGTKKSVVGICYKYTRGSQTWKEIVINKEWWDNANDHRREVLIKHELGHCHLNRDHDNHIHLGVKTSIMNSYVLNSHDYETHKHGYDVELYTKNKEVLLESIGY